MLLKYRLHAIWYAHWIICEAHFNGTVLAAAISNLNVSTHVKNDLLYSSEELVVRSIKRIAYDDYTMMVGERYRD